MIQPPHFIAEVGAVLARESPKTASSSLQNLLDIEMQIMGAEAIYAKAIELSIRSLAPAASSSCEERRLR